jgi:hypothetical protein
MTLVKLGRQYIRNAIRNIPLIPSSRDLSCLYLGKKPALVLGAGPSLDGILDGLSSAFGDLYGKRPFRIICVDTALESLQARNIRPDLAVALESQHWNLRDFIGLGSWDIPVVMDLSALPATAEVLGAQPRIFLTPWAPLRLFDRLEAAGLLPETFPPLGSVGLSAAAMARRLSSGPIILGGLDFSFSPDAYHARSTPGHRDRLRRQTRLSSLINAEAALRRFTIPAISKSGIPVRTDPAMKGYRDLLEREFSRDSRIYDIAGPGLPLGLRTLTPEAAFDMLRGENQRETAGAGAACDMLRGGNQPEAAFDMLRGMDPPANQPETAETEEKLAVFIRNEREALVTLRGILIGTIPAEKLEERLDDADYLWAHFPECAGAEGRRPPGTNISFLKRVRVELEPFITLWERLLPCYNEDPLK